MINRQKMPGSRITAILPYCYTATLLHCYTAPLLHCLTATLLYCCITTSLLHAQNFDSLISELSGSEADQLESEQADQKENNNTSAIFSSSEKLSSLEEDEFTPQKNIKTNGVVFKDSTKPLRASLSLKHALAKS